MTTPRRISAVVLSLATAGVGFGGCGYRDENAAAVTVVARAYVRAYAKRDAAAVCRIIIPPLAATFATEAGGSCERHILSTFTRAQAAVHLGAPKITGSHATVDVVGEPDKTVGLIKFGSLWMVTESWELR